MDLDCLRDSPGLELQTLLLRHQFRVISSRLISSKLTTTIMTANNNFLNLEMRDCEMKRRKSGEIMGVNHIRDITVNKNFSWLKSHNLLYSYSTITAAEIKYLWILSLSKFFEVSAVNHQIIIYPSFVILKYSIDDR